MDRAEAIEGDYFAGTGVEDLAEQFDITAVDLDVIEQDAVIDRIVVELEVGLLDQRVIEVIAGQSSARLVSRDLAGNGVAERDALVGMTGFDQAVDVEVTGGDENVCGTQLAEARIGRSTAGEQAIDEVFDACHFCFGIAARIVPDSEAVGQAPFGVVLTWPANFAPLNQRFTTDIVEGVDIALDKAARGMDIERAGIDVGAAVDPAGAGDVNRARLTDDADVGDAALQGDVRVTASTVVSIADLDLRRDRRGAEQNFRKGRCLVQVQVIDRRQDFRQVGSVDHDVVDHQAATFARRNGQAVEDQEIRALVFDDDFSITGSTQFARADEGFAADIDIA